MYSMGTVNHKNCAERGRLGPPDSYCSCHDPATKIHNKVKDSQVNANYGEFEFADDAISLNRKGCPRSFLSDAVGLYSVEKSPYITVNGKEELPSVHEIKYNLSEDDSEGECNIKAIEKDEVARKLLNENKLKIYNVNGNINPLTIKKVYGYCTLPKIKKKMPNRKYWMRYMTPPKRVTPDGTNIYYWCDLQRRENGKK